LMNRNFIQVGSISNNDVATVDDLVPTFPKPLVIHYTKGVTSSASNGPRSVTIQIPKPFPYKDNKAVPWRYNAEIYTNNPEENHASQEISNIANIAGVGGMTRSGRIYIPDDPRVKQTKDSAKKKEAIVEEMVNEEKKKEVSEEEVCEFLKMIKQSEYTVIDQLNRIPAKISLLSLMMNSESHRKALLKILNEAHVVHDLSVEKFEGIVGNITANNYLTFTDDEIPVEGVGHNKALHISVKCLDHILARVLIDNGSALNVMPKSTLAKLPFDGSYMKPSATIVRAFDGSRREVMGEITLPVQIGPVTFEITFQVMDITPAYTCLLGRPWIHCAGAVPSTLH